MKRFWFYTRLYVILVGKYIQTRMQYRFDFIISTLSMILSTLTGFVGLKILMSNFPLLAGWKFEELVFIYSFSILAQAPLQICFDHIWQLRYHVNSGTFIKYYFKPINSLFYYISEMVDLKGFGQLALGIVIFVWSSSTLGIQWTLARVLFFPLLLVGSSLTITSLMLIAATGCFWVKDSFSILSFINTFREQTRYPLDIYNRVFRIAFTWILPIGFIAFYPSQFYLRSLPLDFTAWLSPVVGFVLFFIALRVWNAGLRAWGGTGS
ncbi:MAG TPA: ABC-2 family transporter protein [Treponemataceae bacterium]|nr:ABC-2 family transporter protein [Treponemataceae bacterium]